MRLSVQPGKYIGVYTPFLRSFGIFAVVFLGCIFGIVPATRATWKLFSELGSLQGEIALLEKKVDILETLEADAMKRNLGELAAAVPSEKSIPTLFATLESVSAQAGVGLIDVTLPGVENLASESAKKGVIHPSGASVIQFSASVDGGMPQVKQFFALLGSVRRLMGIRSFTLTVTSPERVQAKLEMDSYFSPYGIQPAGAAKELSALGVEEETVIEKIKSFPNISQTVELPPPAIGAFVKSDPFAP